MGARTYDKSETIKAQYIKTKIGQDVAKAFAILILSHAICCPIILNASPAKYVTIGKITH